MLMKWFGRSIIACCGVLLCLWLLRPAPNRADMAVPGLSTLDLAHSQGELTVWSWNIAAKSLQQLAPEFEKTQPRIHVNVDMTGARMQTRLMLSLAAGVGRAGRLAVRVDRCASLYRDRTPDRSDAGRREIQDRCFPRRSGITARCKVASMPFPGTLARARVFLQAGSVSALRHRSGEDRDLGRLYRGREDNIAQSGGRTKMLPLGSNSLRPMFEMLIQQNGGQVFDDQGRIAINSPQTRQALALIQKMRAAGICSDIALWSQEFLAGLNDESIATYPIAVWFAGTIKDTVKDFAGKKADWGVFRLPAITPGGLHVANLGGSVLVIPEQCRNKAAAWAFVEYALCTREGQLAQYKSMSLFPAFLPALQTSTWTSRTRFSADSRSAAVCNGRDENLAPESHSGLGRSDPLSGSGAQSVGCERHGRATGFSRTWSRRCTAGWTCRSRLRRLHGSGRQPEQRTVGSHAVKPQSCPERRRQTAAAATCGGYRHFYLFISPFFLLFSRSSGSTRFCFRSISVS